MSIFGKSEIEKMRDAGDVDGLIATLTNDESFTARTEAAERWARPANSVP